MPTSPLPSRLRAGAAALAAVILAGVALLAIGRAPHAPTAVPPAPAASIRTSSPPPGSRLTFAERVYPTDGERQGIAAADVNADGVDDVILGDGGLARVDGLRTRLADRHGGLEAAIVSRTGYEYADHLHPVDLNGDRHPDLLGIGGDAEGDGSASPRAWVGDGRGHFRATFAPTPPEDSGYEMFVSPLDVDDDGVADLAAWFYSDGEDIHFFRGAGDGTFKRWRVTMPDAPSPSNPAMVAADVTGDGHEDLVLGGTDGPLLAFRYRRPSVFDVVKLVGSGVPVGAGDLDADGRDDVVVMRGDTSRLGVVLTGADTVVPVPGAPLVTIHRNGDVRIGDVTGDAHPDLVVPTGREIAIAPGRGAGLGRPVLLPGPSYLGFVALGDFNADGRTDIATLDGALRIFTNAPALRSTRALAVEARRDLARPGRACYFFHVAPRPPAPASHWSVRFAATALALNERGEGQTCLTLPTGAHMAFLQHDGRTAAHATVEIP